MTASALAVNGKPVTVRIAGEVFVPTEVPTMWVSWQTLGRAAAGLAANQYDIALTPGTSTQAYTDALQRALGPDLVVALLRAPTRSPGSWTCPCSSG